MVLTATIKYTAPKYHGINTMVFVGWYFSMVGLLVVNTPRQNTMILYIVNHSIFWVVHFTVVVYFTITMVTKRYSVRYFYHSILLM